MKKLIALIAIVGSFSSAHAGDPNDPAMAMPNTPRGKVVLAQKASSLCPYRSGGTVADGNAIHPSNGATGTTSVIRPSGNHTFVQ